MQYFEMSNADISRNSSFMQNEHIFNIILHFFFWQTMTSIMNMHLRKFFELTA